MHRYVVSSLLLLSIGMRADVARGPNAIGHVRRADVACAVRDALVKLGLGNVVILDEDVLVATVPTTTTAPVIEVEQLQIDSETPTVVVRLRCLHNQCLPFYARLKQVVGLQNHDGGRLLLPRTHVTTKLPVVVKMGAKTRLHYAKNGLLI